MAFLALAPRLPLPATRSAARSFRSGAICMGRRSEKIKTRKTKQAAAKTKLFARIGKIITMAAKAGGPDVTTNKALADALDAARAVNVPKDTTNAAIARATAVDQADFKESSFEAYGHGGVGVFIDVLTDNPNRAAAKIRAVVTRNDMKLASPGSVAFNFDRKGVLRIPADAVSDADALFEAAIEAGAEECDPDPSDSDFYRIITAQADLNTARNTLTDSGYDVDSAVLEMVPKATVDISEKDAELNWKAMELLEEIDDVDAVFSNMSP